MRFLSWLILLLSLALANANAQSLSAQEAYPIQASISYSPQASGSEMSFYNRMCNNGNMFLGFARDKSELAQRVARFCNERRSEDWSATFPQGVTLVFSLTSKGGSPDRTALGQTTFQSMNTVDYEPNEDAAFQKQWHETGYGFAMTMCPDGRYGDDLSEQFVKSGGEIGGRMKEFCETFSRMTREHSAQRQRLMDQNPEAARGRPADNFEELKRNRSLSDALDDAKNDYVKRVQSLFATKFPEGVTGHFALLLTKVPR